MVLFVILTLFVFVYSNDSKMIYSFLPKIILYKGTPSIFIISEKRK